MMFVPHDRFCDSDKCSLSRLTAVGGMGETNRKHMRMMLTFSHVIRGPVNPALGHGVWEKMFQISAVSMEPFQLEPYLGKSCSLDQIIEFSKCRISG